MDEPKVIGDWVLICVLGSGAFGKVDLWRNNSNQEEIAVKKCKFRLPENLSTRQRERWINEVEIMKSLNHENIIGHKSLPQELETIMNKYNPTTLPILSMEYCGKGNLRKFLAQTKNIKGCDEADVRCILQDISHALAYLHSRNITHRDIKPENIVIRDYDHRPTKHIYKLIDLGYAKELDTIASFVGTVPYLAPEIFYTQTYNNSVDHWSFGILTYEIVTGMHPFLPNKTPVERFNYLKEKSDEDISISITRDGQVKFTSEILPCNRLSSVFKRHLEDWLKLLLVYDSKKRGFREGVKKDVFDELKMVLGKKILTVFSVFNYRNFFYEISATTCLSDIKASIERDTLIPRDRQMFVVDKETVIFEDDTNMNDFYRAHPDKIFYLFKKYNDFEPRTVSLPQHVQALLHSPDVTVEAPILRALFGHALFFIGQEKELIEQFDAALILQVEHTNFLFGKIKTVYSRTRANMVKLCTRIECYGNCSEWQSERWSHENQDYLINLTKSRKFLRQAKELAENVNALTDRFRKTLRRESITSHECNLRGALASTEVDMKQKYDSATTLYQKIGSCNMSTAEMTKILSVVLKIPSKAIFLNNDLKTYLRSAVLAQWKLQKLLVWCNALDKQIEVVSSLIEDCEKEKYSIREGGVKIRLPCYLPEEITGIDELIQENQRLRYEIQNISDQGSEYLRTTGRDTLCVWNGVIVPTSQK